jgi:tRNA threonylcarbamoyladenosine biosynthesis protein TsaB
LILAIDTATRFLSIALHTGTQVQIETTWHTMNNHTIELAPAIQQALMQTGTTPADLSAVAVAQGPGSFTGLRIGLGLAKGLATSHGIPLVAVPTLAITAAGVPHFDGSLMAVLQAGRGRVCAQTFGWHAGAWTSTEPAVITTWQTLVETVEQPTLFAGEIDETGRSRLATTERPVSVAPGTHALRRAGFLAEIAWERIRANQTDDPATVTPIYLHQPGIPHP